MYYNKPMFQTFCLGFLFCLGGLVFTILASNIFPSILTTVFVSVLGLYTSLKILY